MTPRLEFFDVVGHDGLGSGNLWMPRIFMASRRRLHWHFQNVRRLRCANAFTAITQIAARFFVGGRDRGRFPRHDYIDFGLRLTAKSAPMLHL